jgi:Spy/CpxP family protein refolding chaperone
MKHWFIALIALVLAGPAMAQVGMPDDPPQDGPPPILQAAHHQVVRFLQLDEDQIAAWDALILIHHDAEQPIREDIAAADEALRVLLEDPEADPEAVGDLVLERRELMQELAEVHRVYLEGFIVLLDDEQQARIGFIKRADEVQPIIPAFKALELIPRH